MPIGTISPEYGNMSSDKVLPNLHERIHELEEAISAIGYDAKASKKRRFPTKRQATVMYSITRALCVETIDPWKENRVRFYHPLIHDPNTKLLSLPFAAPVSSMGGFDDSGLSWVPPAGSTIAVYFEGGSRDAPYYLGTTWHRDRGPGGSQINSVFVSREWNAIYANHRAGNFLHGPDDGSQCLPPWGTESSNGSDIDQIEQFSEDPQEQIKVTYPNIYGFKTPEKHMLKMVDGDAKCNRRWKRIEMMSGCGNWMIFKDDHLHYGGQWAHPSCGAKGGQVETCANIKADLPYFSDIQGEPIEKGAGCDPNCGDTPAGKTQCSNIIGGHSSTPCDPNTKHCNSNMGSNKFFKQRNECRPYKGPGTPQNNSCDLPQSGIQFLSIGGHTFVMDDSVEEPSGRPEWERSLQDFTFGCNDKCLGRLYIKSMTGHGLMMSDVEEDTGVRGENNYVRIQSASGNKVELNDHTVGAPNKDCPPNYAGEKRGITIQSTSNHVIRMIDHMNLQCSPKRREGGTPVAKATQAYLQIRSGYGSELRFNDDNSQETTQRQWLQLTNPQCADPLKDSACNGCAPCACAGPHFLRMQAAPKGSSGIVFLRAGGLAIRQTWDKDIVLVGDPTCNPSDKFTYVSKKHIRATEDIDFRYSGKLHIFMAEQQILLMAGRDCPGVGKCPGPCLYNVIVARCPVYCPLTGILHWTEKAMSERVFASACAPCGECGGGGPCKEDDSNETTDPNAGSVNQTAPIKSNTVSIKSQTSKIQ